MHALPMPYMQMEYSCILKEKRVDVPLIPCINHMIEEGSKESLASQRRV
jgi:hypothetical protein